MTGQLEQFLRGVPTSGRTPHLYEFAGVDLEALKRLGPGPAVYVELGTPHHPGPTPIQLMASRFPRR